MTHVDEHPRTRREQFGLTFRRLEVLSVATVTSRYVRVVVGGDELAGFKSLDPQDHFKLLLPPVGETEPTLPIKTESGFQYPDDKPRPVMRDYTPRGFDPEKNELTIDIALHDDGVASNWARQVKPGDIVGTVGPRGSHIVDYDAFDWFLTAGDETSLPAIARRLEEIPANRKVFAFIEVDGPEDEQSLVHVADATIFWVHRNGAKAGETNVLERAIRAFDFPEGDGYQWYTGEANNLRDIRRYILNERGFDKQWTDFSGHWKYGRADFDHHEPIEE